MGAKTEEATLTLVEKESGAKVAKPVTQKGIVYVGIDMGSFRTSIAASNGVREMIISVVGWPKDVISRKLLGRDIIFGNEAYRHRLALDVVRPLEKGMIKFTNAEASRVSPELFEKHMRAARELIKYAISLTRPQKGDLIYGVLGCPSQATLVNKQALIEAAREALDAVMIVSEPFSVAYGLGMLEDTLVVDIGAGTVDLCRMHGTFPDESDQITLTTAGDWVDEILFGLIHERHPKVQTTINMVREIKEKYGYVHDVNENVKVTLPVDGKPQQVDVTAELREACRGLVPPILDALYRLIATYDPEFQHRMLNNVLLAGGGSQMRGLDRLIEEGLQEYGGGKANRVAEPVYAGANGALKLANEMPDEFWKELR